MRWHKQSRPRAVGRLLLALLLTLTACGNPERPPGLDGSRYCFDQPTEVATISQLRAIELARELGDANNQGPKVSARYVLFSDDKCNQYQEPGMYTRVPAWIVTFHELKIPAGVEGAFFTESHTVIHAHTGTLLSEFMVR